MARNKLPSKREQYIEGLFAQEEQRFKDIWQSAPEELRTIQISPLEGKQIYMMLILHKSKAVLELGTLVGYSTSWILRAMSTEGRVTSIEKSANHYAIASKNLQPEIVNGQLKLLNLDAVDYLSSCDEKFDTIFIDANKAAYPMYLDYALQLLLPGGLLIADNVLLWESVFDESIAVDETLRSAMQKFNTKLADKNLFESIILPTGEGLAIAIKRK